MSPGRTRFIYTLISLIVAGHLVCIVQDVELWPFSQYHMYSHAQTTYELDWIRLYGVTDEANAEEIPLYDQRYLAPFTESNLRLSWATLSHGPEPGARMIEGLQDRLNNYERLRQSGYHDGPPLRGLKLYAISWELDPLGRNIDTPTQKTLLLEWIAEDTP